jgi:hypothetical protein
MHINFKHCKLVNEENLFYNIHGAYSGKLVFASAGQFNAGKSQPVV